MQLFQYFSSPLSNPVLPPFPTLTLKIPSSQNALEEMVHLTRELAAAREAAIAREAAAAAAVGGAADPTGSNVSSAGGAPPAAVALAAAAAAGSDSPAAAEGGGQLSSAAAAFQQQQQQQQPGGHWSQAGAAAGLSAAGGASAAGVGVGSPLASQGSIAAAAAAAAGGGGGGVSPSACFVGGLGLGVAAGGLIASTPGGPVQLTAAAAGLMGDIERLIQATQTSGGQRVSGARGGEVGGGWGQVVGRLVRAQDVLFPCHASV